MVYSEDRSILRHNIGAKNSKTAKNRRILINRYVTLWYIAAIRLIMGIYDKKLKKVRTKRSTKQLPFFVTRIT